MATEIPVKVVLEAVNNASSSVNEVGDSLDKLDGQTQNLTGSFIKAQVVIDLVKKGFDLVKGAIIGSLDAYTEQQDTIAQTEAVLKSTASAAVGTYELIKTGSKGATEASGKLKNELEGATAKLHDMQKKANDGKPDTESFTVALKQQAEKVAELSKKAGDAGDTYRKVFHPAVRMTKDDVLELATALQKQTTFSDEAVLSAENMLLTFTNITKETFPQAISTVLDMSQALGQDLKSSSIQLGKALQDPILGVTALRRVGVNFSDDQQEVIKKLVDTGKTLDAQRMILKELNTEFGGSAAKAADTFSGKIKQLKNFVNDLQEQIGKLIADALSPFVQKITDFVKSDQVQQWFKNLEEAAKKALNPDKLNEYTKTLERMVEPLKNALRATGDFFNETGAGQHIIEQFYDTLKFIVIGISGFGIILEGVAAAFTNIYYTVKEAGLQIELFIAKLQNSPEAMAKITKQLADVEMKHAEFNQKVLEDFAKDQEAFEGLTKKGSENVNQVNKDFEGAFSSIQMSSSMMNKGVTDNFTQMSSSTNTLSTDMQSHVTTTTDTMSSNVQASYQAMSSEGIKKMDELSSHTVASAESAYNGVKPWYDRIADLFNTLLQKAGDLISKVANNTLVGALSKREFGGQVSGLDPVIVGERGPEVFVPSVSGQIIPNNQVRGSSGGMSLVININSDMIINSPNERRNIAIALYEELAKYAKSQNSTVAKMFERSA